MAIASISVDFPDPLSPTRIVTGANSMSAKARTAGNVNG